jgi:uncharacterized protein (TIGR02145 family)
MKKLVCILVNLLIWLLIAPSCKEEVLKDLTRIQETNGQMVIPDSVYTIVRNVNIISCDTIDSRIYEGNTIRTYNLTFQGENLDSIKPGTVVVDNKGIGKAYLIIEQTTKGIFTEGKSIKSLNFKASDISLDFLFNYEGAKIIFSSPENRAKRNSNIDGKIYTNELKPDLNRSSLTDEANLDGYSPSKQGNLINLNFNNADLEVKSASGNSSFTLTLSGNFKLNLGVDFLMEYNPQYFMTDDPGLVAFLMATAGVNPFDLYGKTATALTLGTLKRLKAITYTELDYGLTAELKYKYNFLPEDFKLYKIPLAKVVDVWPTPFPVLQVTKIYLTVDLKASGALTAIWDYHREIDNVMGFDFTQKNFSESNIIWYNEKKSNTTKESSLVVEVKIAAGVKLVIEEEFYIAGILGPEIKGYGYVGLSYKNWVANYGGGWKLSLDAGITGDLSLDLSMFHYDKATWRIVKTQFDSLNYNLYKCPYSVKIIDGDNQVGNVNEKLPEKIKIQVLDKRNKPMLPIFPNVLIHLGGKSMPGFNGDVPLSEVITTNGIVETDWTLDNKEGAQKLHVFLKDADGSILGDPDTVYATAIQSTTGTVFNPNLTYGSVNDIEGNVYRTIQIGSQTWMAENLKTTKYNDNMPIPLETGGSVWGKTSPFYCWYNNDRSTYGNIYGALYNWYAVKTGRLCPTGWHVPSETEWNVLRDYLISNGYNYDGTTITDKVAKSLASTAFWTPNTNTGAIGNTDYPLIRNSSGFSALPGGLRYYDGLFISIGTVGEWWGSTEDKTNTSWALKKFLHNYDSWFSGNWTFKEYGVSVRCLKN